MSQAPADNVPKADWLPLLAVAQRAGFGLVVSINQDPTARAALNELDSVVAAIVAATLNADCRSPKIVNLMDKGLLAEALASTPGARAIENIILRNPQPQRGHRGFSAALRAAWRELRRIR